MTPQQADDAGLAVLVERLGREKETVSESLLRRCYDIEKRYQYDRDRSSPLEEIRRLVDREVDRRIAEVDQAGDAQ